MSKVKTMLRRVKEASFSRMNQNIQTIHKETGRNRAVLAADMVWCAMHYGVGYLEYHVFGFANVRGKNRKTFMTMNHNLALTRMVNDKSLYPIMNDKIRFLEVYGDFIGRRWIDLRKAGEQGLKEMADCGVVFAKPVSDFGGKGVEKITLTEDTDVKALTQRLMEGGQFLVEEGICQHPQMAAICPSSVNTLRIVTLMVEGKAKFLYALLRVGSGKSHVDNISSGGMYTFIGEEGRLEFPAFCDKTGLYYDRHPVTGVSFPGFQIPQFHEAVELCLKAAQTEPRLGYIGWDVAVTEHGPILVEGNVLPGYDMVQNSKFHPEGKGILPVVEAALGKPVPKQ